MNLTATLETVRVFRDKDSREIISIEVENGHIDRYFCKHSTNALSNEMFECDKPVK